MADEFAKTKTKFWDAARRLREVQKAGEHYEQMQETPNALQRKYAAE